ncbi:hypothetical protein [Azospirillum doebereinerae]|uniref:hypothetical protein n=1 Tax=Azospirillum doebereinerae TaxID=92933 RepID=UPI003CC82AF2
MKAASRNYGPEMRERAVRMVFEHASPWAAIGSIVAVAKIGCNGGDAAGLAPAGRA